METDAKWFVIRDGKVILQSDKYVAILAVWLANYRPTDELLLADDWRARKRLERAAEGKG